MSNTSSSGSNDEYPSNNDSNWTTPELDSFLLLPDDLNVMLGSAYQLQADLNSIPAITNAASNDMVDPFGDDGFLDSDMLALLQDPQALARTLDALDVNIPGGTGGHMPSHAQHAEQGMPLVRNARGAHLPVSPANRDMIAPTGQQRDTTLPRFVDDDRGAHMAPSHASVQHAGAPPYYNGPPQGTELPFGRQDDWTALPAQDFDDPTNAYQQLGYGAGPAQQFGAGNANLQLPPPPPPPPTYGPTTHGPSPLGHNTPGWQQAPPSFRAGQGTRAPLTFAETVNAMRFEAWAAQPPPRSVGFLDRGRTQRPTGQRGRREPGAPAQTPASDCGRSQSGTARGAPVADVHRQGQFRSAPQVPSALGMAQEFWMLPPNAMPALPDLYRGMPEHDPAVHGRQTLAAAGPARDDDALQRPGTSRPAAESALGDAHAPQSAPGRQRPHPPPAGEDSGSQAATTHSAPMLAPDATPAMAPVESNSTAPRALGKKRTRNDDEQAGPAPKKSKKARSAPAAAEVDGAPAEPSERDPDRFRQFCARVGASPGETPGAGPSNLGRNVQKHNNFIAHSGTQENSGEVEKIRIWDGPESERPTPEEGGRYPLHGPRPKDHDWYCRFCHDRGRDEVKRLYWQTVEKAQLHVGRQHPVEGEPRHVVERGKGSGTKRKKQPPKDKERREDDKDKEDKE